MSCFKSDKLDCKCPVECPTIQLTKKRRYTWMNSSGCVVSRPLTDYECQLEDDVQQLQDALFSISSHYAKIQFRLRQIATSSGYEQECLLRELERITSQGIDKSQLHDELPNLLSDSHSFGNVRVKQQKIISDIRSRLTNLAEVADVCFCAESESSYNLRKNHQRQLEEAAFVDEPTNQPTTEEHEKNCSCVVCQERMEEKCKMPAYERGYLTETWPSEDNIDEQAQTKKKKKPKKISLEKMLSQESHLLNPCRSNISRSAVSVASGKKTPKERNSTHRNPRINGVHSARSLNRGSSVNSKSFSKSNQNINRQKKGVSQKPSRPQQFSPRSSRMQNGFDAAEGGEKCVRDCKCPGSKRSSPRVSASMQNSKGQSELKKRKSSNGAIKGPQSSKMKYASNQIESNTAPEPTRRSQSSPSNSVEYKAKRTNMNRAKDTLRRNPQSYITLLSGDQVEHKNKNMNIKKAKESPRLSPQGSEMQYSKTNDQLQSECKSTNCKASCAETSTTMCPGNQVKHNVTIKRSTRCTLQTCMAQYPDNQVEPKNKSMRNNRARESPRSSSPSPRNQSLNNQLEPKNNSMRNSSPGSISPSPRIQTPDNEVEPKKNSMRNSSPGSISPTLKIQCPNRRVEPKKECKQSCDSQRKSLKASKSKNRNQSSGQSSPQNEIMQCAQDGCEFSRSSLRSKESQQRPAKKVQYMECECSSESELSSGRQNSLTTVLSQDPENKEGDFQSRQVPKYNCTLAEMSTQFVHKRDARTLCDMRSCKSVCSKTGTCWDQQPDEKSKKASKKELKTCDNETCSLKQAKRQAKKKPEKKENKKDLKSKSMTLISDIKPLTSALKAPRNFVETQKNTYLIYPNVPAKYGSQTKNKCGRRFCRLFCNKFSKTMVDQDIKKVPRELKLSESLTNPFPQTSTCQGHESVLQELKSRFRAKELGAKDGNWRLAKL
ncbi:uncharacterized protein LOC135433547 [Drosophila montana]|uniref:uncharacterized protein LOC135433547 n=1 Tax=Drosophila montana TaxID=40370 RepID=UPI00313C3191